MSPAAHSNEKTTFEVPLTAECPDAAESGASGVAVVKVNAETGEIKYRVEALNLPGDLTAAHIHGPDGGIAQGLQLTTGDETGLVAKGTATNLALAAAILANPASFYINVHTTKCGIPGAIRGSLG
jgi:hypothetical protein